MLDPRPARADLTDREVAKIICSLLGGLLPMTSDVETLRNAVRWCADTDRLWESFSKMKDSPMLQRVIEHFVS